jgi:hypothetical protein
MTRLRSRARWLTLLHNAVPLTAEPPIVPVAQLDRARLLSETDIQPADPSCGLAGFFDRAYPGVGQGEPRCSGKLCKILQVGTRNVLSVMNV